MKKIIKPVVTYFFKVGDKIITNGGPNYKAAHAQALIHKQRTFREPLKKLEYLGKGPNFEKDYTKLDKTRS